MLAALYKKLKAAFARSENARPRPIHGDHGEARDIEYVLKKRRYSGSRDRKYLVHLPPAYRRGGPKLPVVMILHGCDQDHLEIRHVADFDRLADRHGIIVVYPFVTSYEPPRMKNCWAFWSRRHNRAGAGEVEDLWQILGDVRRRFGADEKRLHVAGLSSGGSMTVALLVNRCDKIASGAEIAGLAYSEIPPSFGLMRHRQKPLERIVAAMEAQMGRKKRRVPLLIVHATGDRIINVNAAAKVQESWALSFGIETSRPAWSKSGTTRGTPWVHRRFKDENGRDSLSTFLLDHNEHGWYGGRDGKYGYADAPAVSETIWGFFQANPLDSESSAGGSLLRRPWPRRVA
jgi:poly(hydroxyalkanoate) depolymerase family esterase